VRPTSASILASRSGSCVATRHGLPSFYSGSANVMGLGVGGSGDLHAGVAAGILARVSSGGEGVLRTLPIGVLCVCVCVCSHVYTCLWVYLGFWWEIREGRCCAMYFTYWFSCVDVCVYAFFYVCISTMTDIYTHTCVYVCFIHVYTHLYIYICMCMFRYTYMPTACT